MLRCARDIIKISITSCIHRYLLCKLNWQVFSAYNSATTSKESSIREQYIPPLQKLEFCSKLSICKKFSYMPQYNYIWLLIHNIPETY